MSIQRQIIAAIAILIIITVYDFFRSPLSKLRSFSEPTWHTTLKINYEERIKFRLVIINNPFELTEEDELYISVSDKLVYRGMYGKGLTIFLTPEMIGGANNRADISFKKGGKYYGLSSKRLFTIDRDDKYLHLVFYTYDGLPDNYIFFADEEAQ